MIKEYTKYYLAGGALLGLCFMLASYFLDNSYYAIAGGVSLFPVTIYLFLYEFKWLYYFMVFVLPLSINLENIGFGIGLSLPGEILLVLVLIGVVWRMIFRFETYKSIILHPISFFIFAHVIWMVVTTMTSVLVPVSLKFLVLRVIYIVVFYIYGAKLFLESGRLERFVSVYLIGFLPVILFSLIKHYIYDMSFEQSNKICFPFFNDHTIYAACIAMLLPLLFSFLIKDSKRWMLISSVILLLFVALYFSYSRAGLISVGVGFVLFLFLYFKVQLRWIIVSLLLVLSIGGAFLVFKNPFVHKKGLEKEDTFSFMISSLTDKSNDSNSERLNRWMCAYEMFQDRPFLGFGPGTYMFVYGRYQKDKTFISVNDSSMGGAHSQYFKPLSEQGFLGLVLVFMIMGVVLLKGQDLSMRLEGNQRLIVIACAVSLVTYYIHGIFNFFLDTDKASVLFWGLIAYLVAYDIRNKALENSNKDQ